MTTRLAGRDDPLAETAMTDPLAAARTATTRAAPIGDHAADLCKTFPDLSFEVERLRRTDDGTVLLQWIMRGTQEGPLDDLPPTGETVALPGTDVIEVGPDGVTSVRGYFDSGTMMEQLGFRVDVQPDRLGPLSFGTAARLDLGTTTEPGAFSLTYIAFRDTDDAAAVQNRTQAIIREMTSMEGVLGAVFASVGGRGYTVTAWDDPDDARQLMDGGTHPTAVQELFERDGLGAAGMTSIWTPDRLNGRLVRCTACGEMTYEIEAEACPDCGASLPETPTYW
jgi:hypothetical protein